MEIGNQWWQHLILYLTVITILLFYSIESRTLINTVTEQKQWIYQEQDSQSPEPFHSNEHANDKLLFICQTDGYFPDRQDRQKYHICNSGIDTVVSCPDGAIWDIVKESCFYINMISCKNDVYQIYEIKNTEKVTRGMTTKFLTKLHGIKTSTTSNVPIITSSNVTPEHRLHSIFSNEKSQLNEFSPIKTPVENRNESLNRTSSQSQMNPVDSSFKCPPGIKGYFPDPYDCASYHFCSGMDDYYGILSCSGGLFYSPSVSVCDWPDKVPECQYKCPPDRRHIYYPTSSDSYTNHYYECKDGQLIKHMCPERYHYSSNSKKCEKNVIYPVFTSPLATLPTN